MPSESTPASPSWWTQDATVIGVRGSIDRGLNNGEPTSPAMLDLLCHRVAAATRAECAGELAFKVRVADFVLSGGTVKAARNVPGWTTVIDAEGKVDACDRTPEIALRELFEELDAARPSPTAPRETP